MIASAPESGDLDFDQLSRIIRQSENSCARASAWILLEEQMEQSDLHELEMELRSLWEFRTSNSVATMKESDEMSSNRLGGGQPEDTCV